jgi:hypothetical protein
MICQTSIDAIHPPPIEAEDFWRLHVKQNIFSPETIDDDKNEAEFEEDQAEWKKSAFPT